MLFCLLDPRDHERHTADRFQRVFSMHVCAFAEMRAQIAYLVTPRCLVLCREDVLPCFGTFSTVFGLRRVCC